MCCCFVGAPRVDDSQHPGPTHWTLWYAAQRRVRGIGPQGTDRLRCDAAGYFQADILDHAVAAIVLFGQHLSFFEFKIAFDGM